MIYPMLMIEGTQFLKLEHCKGFECSIAARHVTDTEYNHDYFNSSDLSDPSKYH